MSNHSVLTVVVLGDDWLKRFFCGSIPSLAFQRGLVSLLTSFCFSLSEPFVKLGKYLYFTYCNLYDTKNILLKNIR